MTDKSYTIFLPIYDFHISKISFEALNILLQLKYTRLHAHNKINMRTRWKKMKPCTKSRKQILKFNFLKEFLINESLFDEEGKIILPNLWLWKAKISILLFYQKNPLLIKMLRTDLRFPRDFQTPPLRHFLMSILHSGLFFMKTFAGRDASEDLISTYHTMLPLHVSFFHFILFKCWY